MAIPAFSPPSGPFYAKAGLWLLAGKCTLFANIAEYGGTKIFAGAEKANLWFTDRDGTQAIGRGCEGLLYAQLDLAKQFEVRKSTGEHSAVQDVRLYPIVYATDSEEIRQFSTTISSVASGNRRPLTDLADLVRPFVTLDYKAFPQLMQEKLRHFIGHVAPLGTVPDAEAQRWLEPLVVSGTSSTDVMRCHFCSDAIDTVNALVVAGRNLERQEDLVRVYSWLAKKRIELSARIQVPMESPASLSQQRQLPLLPTSSVESLEDPFIDRETPLDRIRRFLSQHQESAFVFSGMKGIGKTSVMKAAFRQAIPSVWKRIWIQLTEGTSYPRLLAELAFQCKLNFRMSALIDRYSNEYGSKKKSSNREKSVLKGIRMELGNLFVREVDGNSVDRWYKGLTENKGLSPGTAVRHFNVMHHMMEKAATIWSKDYDILDDRRYGKRLTADNAARHRVRATGAAVLTMTRSSP